MSTVMHLPTNITENTQRIYKKEILNKALLTVYIVVEIELNGRKKNMIYPITMFMVMLKLIQNKGKPAYLQ